ncbi:MAG: helix-turn-helix domain-containing protein, partial [Lachnospiraceae bacterium]|nr:helix-turn-helix domain-containing protein [Lachnospiraceae bacterium]
MNLNTLKQNAFSSIRSADSLAALEDNLLLYFLGLAEQLSENTNPEYSFLVRNALNYVKDNYHDCNLSLKTLAGQMEVNASYLGRQFSLETKEYFSDYLNRIQIAQALQLLNDTSWTASRIAEAVGFTNVSYFFTIFKKITGKRPSD